MKKFLAVLAVLSVVPLAHAESDVEPWESVYKQREYKKPQKFSREIYTEYPLQSAFVDAGIVRAAFLDAGTVLIMTDLRLGNAAKVSMTNNGTSCNLDAGSPAQCDVNGITANANCICSPVGVTAAIAGNGCAVSLTSNKLTVTGPNSAAYDVKILCDR